ncbi:MAG: hypothetical protein OEY41_16500, partial [Acidimicrobiia bacterium]|nr:hypothetical protein [Acidimicrobiia bacterium]
MIVEERLTSVGVADDHGDTRMPDHVEGTGTPDDPWILTTPPGKSEFDAWRDEEADPPALKVRVGSTNLSYRLRCIEDLHAML